MENMEKKNIFISYWYLEPHKYIIELVVDKCNSPIREESHIKNGIKENVYFTGRWLKWNLLFSIHQNWQKNR